MAMRNSLAGFIIILLLTGCVTMTDPESSQEYSADKVATIYTDRPIGQTLVSRRGSLNGIFLWLDKKTDAIGSLNVDLFDSSISIGNPIYSTSIPLQKIYTSPLFIPILTQTSASEQNYYIQLTVDEIASGSLSVKGRLEDAYPLGTLYLSIDKETQPVNADMAFRLTYEYNLSAVQEDLSTWFKLIWLIFPFGMLLILPGWLMLDLSSLRTKFDGGEQIAISVGLSLAILPLILLWSTIFGFHWHKFSVIGISLILVLAFLWRVLRNMKRIRDNQFTHHTSLVTTHRNLGWLLIGVFMASLFVRLAMVRDLAFPAWVDSVHHGTITQEILNQGQYPPNYQPFIDVDAQKYHAGYHANLAFFLWLSGLDIAKGMLIYSQIHNALIVFAVYFIGKRLSNDALVGLFAALIAGLVTPMPAYYTSWGRYTQLAGLLILPVIVILFKSAFIDNFKHRRELLASVILISLSAGGLFIVHYRVSAYAFLFIIAISISELKWQRTYNITLLKRVVIWGMFSAIIALLLALPWAWPTFHGVFAPIVANGSQPGKLFADFSWNYLTAALGKISLWLGAIGFLWGLIRRQRWATGLAIWGGLLVLLANLGPLGVPGANTFANNTAVTITFFIPISIWAGYAIGQAYTVGQGWLPTNAINIIRGILILTVLCLGFAGGKKLIPILRPSTILARAGDQTALEWAKENIPPDEIVVINPFLWGYNLYAGQDGGFWLSPYSEIRTLPPPVLYGMEPTAQREKVNEISQEITNNGNDPHTLREILEQNGLKYIFIGQRGGPISPKNLNASPEFDTLYQKDGVWVFKIHPQPTP